MKTTNLITVFAVFLIWVIIFACKKEKTKLATQTNQTQSLASVNSSESVGAEEDECVRFDVNIIMLSKGLIEIVADKNLRDAIFEQVAKDDGFEAFLADFITPNCDNPNKPRIIDPLAFKNKMNESIRKWENINDNYNRDRVTELMNSLVYKGKKYPGKIRIPNYNTADLSLEPIVTAAVGDENDDIPGWRVQNSSLYEMAISEQYAMNSQRAIIIVGGGQSESSLLLLSKNY